jgi:uncharacterized protein YutD
VIFSLILSNPSYNHNLDLKILKEIYDLGEKICFVHPARWLLNQKPSNDISYKMKENFNDSYNYFEILNAYDYFPGTQINEGLSISFFDKTRMHSIEINDKYEANETYFPENLYDISKYGSNAIFKSVKKKTLSYCETRNLLKMQDVNSNLGFEVSFSGIQNYMALLAKYPGKTDYPIKLYFSTKKEKNNFENFLRTKPIRFCLSIYKMGRNLNSGELASVPYLPTYEHAWTDEQIGEVLGWTDKELAWAINQIYDYYPEDAEKYAKYKNK